MTKSTDSAFPDEHGSMCFYCPRDGIFRAWVHLISPVRAEDLDPSSKGALIRTALGRPQPDQPRGGMWIEAYACAEHKDALTGGLMHLFGGASGRSLPSTCSHPFHSPDITMHTEWAETTNLGNGWVSESYRCPECGFATFQQVTVDETSAAARLVIDSIRRAAETPTTD